MYRVARVTFDDRALFLFVSESVLVQALRESEILSSLLCTFNSGFDEAHADISAIVTIDTDVEIDPTSPHLDMLLSLYSIREREVVPMPDEEYDEIVKSGIETTTMYLRCRVVDAGFVYPELYLEDDLCRSFPIPDDVTERLFSGIQLGETPAGSVAEEWDALDYIVEITRLSREDGGGYIARIPQLGSWTFQADGETPAEALSNLQQTYMELTSAMRKQGISVPPPIRRDV